MLHNFINCTSRNPKIIIVFFNITEQSTFSIKLFNIKCSPFNFKQENLVL